MIYTLQLHVEEKNAAFRRMLQVMHRRFSFFANFQAFTQPTRIGYEVPTFYMRYNVLLENIRASKIVIEMFRYTQSN